MKAPSITGGHIEVSPIRLSQEEARIVMQVAVAGKPIPGTYQYRQLAELGILKAIDIPEEKDTARKIADAWKKARGGFAQKDCDIVHQAMHDIEKLSTDRHREKASMVYDLTDLGRQVARGISVRKGAS